MLKWLKKKLAAMEDTMLRNAESFYKEYGGNGFLMSREEPEKYEGFKNLNLDRAIIDRWDRELVEEGFEVLWDDPENVWSAHSRLLERIFRYRDDREANAARLLSEMKKMESLPKKQKILIIETMAGRTADRKTGGCCVICTQTGLAAEMDAVMGALMDFSCDERDNEYDGTGAWSFMQERLEIAKTGYREAFAKFSAGTAEV